jgi:signal transduction histidine kinase
MGDGAMVVIVTAGLAAAGLGVLIGRRSLDVRLSGLEEEIKRTTTALQRRERDSRGDRQVQDLILGSMRDGVLLFDGGWATAFANASAERHLGGRPSALAQLVPLDLRELVRGVAERGEAATTEVSVEGPARWLRATAVPAGDDGSVLLVLTDITQTRRIEAVRRDFVANASHELKTPAASIQAAAETLHAIAEEDPAAVPRFAGQLEREALRLSRIVADLLDLSRLESGSELAERVRLDVLAREEAERFEGAVLEAGLVLTMDVAGPATVTGSERDCSLLIRNLIDNAIRYTKPGGRIDVGVHPEERRVRITVADTGIGIPSGDLPRVFERFYRVDRARSRETGGTGLGLAIVKHVAENHGGAVDVASELSRGSTFTVSLPAAREA